MMQQLPDCQYLSPFFPSSYLSADEGRSAVNLGYLVDPFVSHLYRPKYGESSQSSGGSSRKPPLINVGTHHRTWAIDLLVDQFLERGGKQIVSLGAGSDTRFWRLMVCP
jgi:[phosphatase 2A protein]-leucine-carboxy methyltransferase